MKAWGEKTATMRKNTWDEKRVFEAEKAVRQKNACLQRKKAAASWYLWARIAALRVQGPSPGCWSSSYCQFILPWSIEREFLMALLRMVTDHFCGLCAVTMEIQCLYKQRGTVLYFHQATSEKKITAIPGIHYFDAHRLDALLFTGPELQLYLQAGNLQNRKSRRCRGSFLTKNYPRLMEKTRVMMLTRRTWNVEKVDTIMARVQPLSTSSHLRTWCAAGFVAPGQTD